MTKIKDLKSDMIIRLISGIFTLILIMNSCNNTLDIDKKAERIHREIMTLDSHTDTPMDMLRWDADISQNLDGSSWDGKVDLPRMQMGGLDAVFFAVWVGQGPRTPEGNRKANDKVSRTIQAVHNAIEANRDRADLALTADDAQRIAKSGKHAIYIGIENGYAIGQDLSEIERFYNLGARYITLCHTENNDICDSSNDTTEHGGLSVFGEEVVREINRLGMIVDVSHVSDKAFYDVLEISSVPVIASHSCARASCDNPRNLSDEMLLALAEKGGVIQVAIYTEYVKTPEPNPERDAALKALDEKYPNYNQMTDDEKKPVLAEHYAIREKYPLKLASVSDMVNHIDHIVKLIGIDHVGIGTDFDGGGELADLKDVSQMPNITKELLKRGYSKKDILKIWSGNFLRVFREAERGKG
ncbi:MAG: dipeptidase [Candidatus Marinimicrobia bacterium]|nr:dipeptidase [Candidatus Neomarinimicrobiota bacterium]